MPGVYDYFIYNAAPYAVFSFVVWGVVDDCIPNDFFVDLCCGQCGNTVSDNAWVPVQYCQDHFVENGF